MSDQHNQEWIPAGVAARAYGVSEAQLYRWGPGKSCRWLGRPVGWRWERGYRRHKVVAYLKADLDAVAAARAAGRSAGESSWPSTAEAIADGWTQDILKRLRRRKQVRTRRGVRMGPGDFAVGVTEWHPGDLNEARAERQARGRREDRAWVTDRQAARPPFCVPPRTVAHWRRRCPYLGGRPLRAELRNGAWYNSREDLEAALRARADRRDDEHVDPDGTVWLPTALVERRHRIVEQVLNGFRRRDERVRRANRGRPRTAPPIRSKVISRRHKKIPNGKLRVWHQGDVLRYVAWRNGVEVEAVNNGTTAPVDEAEKPRRGRPRKYPQALDMALRLFSESADPEPKKIYRQCKEAYGKEEPIPGFQSFMRVVRKARSKAARN
jgi:hypothetical protein